MKRPAFDLGFARLDLDRERRQGLPEVVYGPGKTTAQIAAVVAALLTGNTGPVLVTRVAADVAEAVLPAERGGHDAEARLLVWRAAPATTSTWSSSPRAPPTGRSPPRPRPSPRRSGWSHGRVTTSASPAWTGCSRSGAWLEPRTR